MKSIIFTTFIATSLAAPLVQWSPALGEFYAAVDRHIQIARQAGSPPPTCDLSKAVLPTAPTPLPAPNADWILSEVVVGRGVQNYTCAGNAKTDIPKAKGAVASLYNVSCIAANYPDILAMIPGLALQYALPADPTANLEPSNLLLAGHHYFSSNGTPTFDLTQTPPPGFAKLASPGRDLGIARFKANSNSTAPADAIKGENGAGNGAVPWLMLDATTWTTGNVKAVYRVNTAGGKAPATCESSPADFSVQYATEYWFYSKLP